MSWAQAKFKFYIYIYIYIYAEKKIDEEAQL